MAKYQTLKTKIYLIPCYNFFFKVSDFANKLHLIGNFYKLACLEPSTVKPRIWNTRKWNKPRIWNTFAANRNFYYINHLAYGILKPRKWNIFLQFVP